MENVAADAPLDYVEFRNSSSPNNYDVVICCHGMEEKVGCASVYQLSSNLPEGGCSHAKFKLHLPQDSECASWFSKATVMRFLKITELTDALNIMSAIANEMSQLEETRKFQVSLYGQAGNGAKSSEESKNELLRAMDSRLVALRVELTAAFDRAAGEACSREEMENLDKFCEQFGCASLRTTVCKLLESNRKVDGKAPVTGDSLTDSIQISEPSTVDQTVECDASPAKVTHITEQQQSSTESNDNSSSNASEEEEDGGFKRSRTRTRSATPRRSASPMRRIQIGKSGSRRTPAIAVKSLSYFPGRERVFSSQNDDESGLEQTGAVPESTVRRMSVQDAISLFERKQKDQSNDVQRKIMQLNDNPPVKSVVLRRWSSGMGESSATKLRDQRVTDINVVEKENNNRLVEKENNYRLVEEEQESSDVITSGVRTEICPVNSSFPESEEGIENGKEPKRADVVVENERMNSVEWNRQKEEELKDLLMSFAVTNQPSSKDKKTGKSNQQSGMGKEAEPLSDQKKNKRDRRPQPQQGEKAETKMVREAPKKTEKQASPRVVRKSIVKTTKVDLSSSTTTTGSDVKKKQVVASRTIQKEKTVEPLLLSSNVKREPAARAVAKNALPKKISSNISPSSTPSSIGSRKILAKKTPPPPPDMTKTSGSKPLRQKSQLSAVSLTKSTPPRVENLKPQRKEVRKAQVVDNCKRSQTVNGGGGPQVRPKRVKSIKPDVLSVDEEKATMRGEKPGPRRSKTTKKSSVVPLESSNEIQKVCAAASPAKSLPTPAKRKGSPSPVKKPLSESTTPVKEKQPLTRNETLLPDKDDNTSEPTAQKMEEDSEEYETNHIDLESEAPPVECFTASEGLEESPIETNPEIDHDEDSVERMSGSSSPAEANHEDVPIISPTVWVENGHEQDLTSESASQVDSSSHDDAGSRVRQSLSQMLLLEEMSEPDDTAEWGHAENPPSNVVQKEAPKGLKKLLKFARKNRGETADLSSIPRTFEGENDGARGKSFARSNPSNRSFQIPSSGTSKASRSFFSLSALRGTKATDSKAG